MPLSPRLRWVPRWRRPPPPLTGMGSATGVHIIGDRAAEIVHIGQAVLSMGGTIEYFRDTVFNYPTLAEAYKVAALDGLNKL